MEVRSRLCLCIPLRGMSSLRSRRDLRSLRLPQVATPAAQARFRRRQSGSAPLLRKGLERSRASPSRHYVRPDWRSRHLGRTQPRRWSYQARAGTGTGLPRSNDLATPRCPRQAELPFLPPWRAWRPASKNSCTAASTCGALATLRRRQGWRTGNLATPWRLGVLPRPRHAKSPRRAELPLPFSLACLAPLAVGSSLAEASTATQSSALPRFVEGW